MEVSSEDSGMEVARERPSVLITGTPGVGKTTLSALVAQRAALAHLNVGALVAERALHDGRDEQWGAYLLNEDKVCDELEEQVSAGGCVVDHHGCDFFPERWFDLVVVLMCDNTVLWDRLQERGYPQKKIQENVECEIMQVVQQEAYDSYKKDIVWVLPSETSQQMSDNADKVCQWISQWSP